jgi:hypothetical protein
MSISSVSSAMAPLPVQAPEATATPAPAQSATDDAGASQEVQAPLPPGQGTRVNQLV